jgi:hypothetical protein
MGVQGQSIFEWPLRASPQPEAVLTGGGAVFWNHGGLASTFGTEREIWLMHVDGPDVTGVRGVAVAGVVDLPEGLRGGIGYWHLGIQDIPRTTSSPDPEDGEVNISEDVGVVSLAWGFGGHTGIGGGLRFTRGAAGREARSQVAGEVGIQHQSNLPLTPRFGVSIHGIGRETKSWGGVEVSLPPLYSSQIPLRAGYGIQTDGSLHAEDHRFSFRASWMDQFHLGVGSSYLGGDNGWTPLWMLGADIGRYSFSVLRESLANNFGAVHFFQASLRLQ